MFAGVSCDQNCLENILSTTAVDLLPENVAGLQCGFWVPWSSITVSYHLATAAEDGMTFPETTLLLYEVLFLFCMWALNERQYRKLGWPENVQREQNHTGVTVYSHKTETTKLQRHTCSKLILFIWRSGSEINIRLVFLLKNGMSVNANSLVQVLHFICDEKIASVK